MGRGTGQVGREREVTCLLAGVSAPQLLAGTPPSGTVFATQADQLLPLLPRTA